MDFTKVKLNNVLKAETSRSRSKSCNGRTNNEFYSEIHIPLPSKWTNSVRGDGEKHENSKRKAKQNRENSSKKNYSVELRPGHYQLSVHWPSKPRPVCITLTPEKENGYTPPGEQQPLLYDDVSPPSPSSFPRRVVNKLFPPSTSGAASNARNGSHHPKVGGSASRKRQGGGLENQSRYYQRKGKHRWASLSCIHFANLDDDDAFGGYEGVEHLKRTSLGEVRGSSEGVSGSDLYFINNFASSQCHSLLDVYSTSTSTAHVCKLNKVVKDTDVPEKTFVSHSLDELISYCKEDIKFKRRKEPSLGAIERRTWHEYENFLSRVVDEYFRETVPVSDLENILGSGKMCSKKRSKRSDVYSLRRRSPYERSVWSTPPALNSPEAMKKSLQRSDDINKSSNELNTYSGCNERKMSISDGIYRSSDEENSWYSDESLGYRADTEGSDKETVSEVVVPFKYCENTPNLNYKKRVFKESCKNSKARMYFEWAKETRQMNMERRYAVSVDSLLNYNPFTKFPDFNTATLPNLIFNLKNNNNNNNNNNNKDFNPKNAYNGYDEIEKYTEMLDEKKREIVEHLLCDFAKSTSSYSEDFPGLANKSNSFIERGYCASGKNEMTASPSSLCDIDKILNKGLVINHSEGKVPSETISLYSSPSAEENNNNNNNNNSFDENSLYLEENFPQLNEESKVLLTDGFPITRNIVIISEDENFVKKRESHHLSEIDINDKNSLHSYTSKSWSTLGVNKLGRCHNEDNSIYLKPLDFKSDLCYKANICNELKKPSDFSADLISLESVCDPIWPRNCGSLRERMSSCRSRHLEFAPSHTLGDEARVGPDRKVSKVTQDALLGKPLITEASLPTPEVSHPHLRASRSSPRAQGASLVQLLPSLENRDRVCECSMGSVQSGEGRKSCDVEDSLRDWEKAGKNVNPRRPKSRKYFSEIFENFGSSRTPNKRENFPAYSSYGGARSSSSFASPTSNFVKDSDVGSNRANPSFVKCNTNNDKEKLSISVVPNSSQPNSSCQGSKLWKTANDQPNSSERFKKQEVKCEKSELRSHSYVNDDHNFLSKESSFRVYPTHGERAFRNVSDVDRNPVEKLRSSSHLYENTYFHEHRYVGEFSYINSLIESCASEEEGLSPSTDCRSSPSRDSTPATSSSEVTDRGEEFSQKSDPPPDTLAKKTPPINLPEEEEEEEEDDPMSADEETSESSSGKFSVCRSESSESVASDASSFYYTAGGSELYDAVEEVTKYFSFIDKIDSEQSSNRPTERDETPTKMTPGASKDDDGGGDGNNDSDDDDDDDDDNNNDNDDDNNDDDDNDDDNNDDDDDDGDTEATALIDSENNTPTSSPSEEPFTSFFDLKKSNSYSFSSHEYVNANVVVKDSQILVTIKPGVENFPPDHLNDDTNNEDCNPIYENSSPSANAERNEKSPCKSKHSDDGLVYASPCVTHSDSENEIKVFDTKAFPDDVNLPETDQTQQHREKDEVHFDIGVRIPQLRECLSEGDIKLSDKDYDFDDESSLYAPLTVSEEESEGLRTSVDDVSSLPERYSDTSHSSSSPEPACEGHQNQYPIPRFPSEARPVIHVGLEDPHRQCASNVVWNRLDLNPEGSFIAFDTSTVSPITNCFPFGFSPPVSPVDAKKPPPFPHRGRESSSLPREGQSQSQMRRRCRSVSSADTASRRRNRRRVVSMIKTSQESLHDHWFCPGDRAPDTRWVAERKKAEGNEFYKSKQYREAIKLYSDAIELCPECASYYSNRSACHMMLGKFTQALADAREAVRLDASFVKGYIRVAKCNIALGDPNAALSILRQATELEPGNKTVRDEVTNANALIRCGDEVEKATMKKDYRTAIYYLDRALDLAAGCRSLKITKAEYLVYLHRHGEAQEIVNEILQFDSGNVDAIYVRGLCLYYQDNQEAAFTHFQHVLKLAPDHKKAKESYKKAKVLKVKKEEGNQAFNKGNFREALNLYTEALAIDVNNKTTNSKLYSNRATAKAKLGKLDEAVDDCTAAINLNEGYVKAYLRRAKCYQDLEKHEDAVRDYEKVCKLDKNQEHKRLLHDANEQLKCSKRKDYYKILGVSRNATEDDIKKSYKKMALQHHPDRHANASDKEKQEHEIKFKEIGEAYAVLTDPKKRSMYDRGQDINDPDCGLGHGGVDPNQIFQAFFSSGGANFSFGHHGGFSQSSFGGGGGGGGGFPGGLHFQFG